MEDWDAKQDAKDLMEIARKELQREIEAEIKEALRIEYEKGRADVMHQFGFDSNGYDPVYVFEQIKSKWPMAWEKMIWRDIETSGKVHCKSYDKGKAEALQEFEEKYKQSWFNEGKIAGRFEGLTEDEKYQQGFLC